MDESAVEFIRNLNDFNSSEGEDFNWGKESEEWWDKFRREKLDTLEYDTNGKVLVVIELGGLVGYAQMRWVRTLAAIFNEGLKRNLQAGEIEVEGLARIDVDGVEYVSLNGMSWSLLTAGAKDYLIQHYTT